MTCADSVHGNLYFAAPSGREHSLCAKTRLQAASRIMLIKSYSVRSGNQRYKVSRLSHAVALVSRGRMPRVTVRPHYRDEFTASFGDPHSADHNEPVSGTERAVMSPTHGAYGFSAARVARDCLFSQINPKAGAILCVGGEAGFCTALSF